MVDSPFSSFALELLRVIHEHAGYFCVLRIFRFGCAKERLEGEEGGFDCEYWRPG